MTQHKATITRLTLSGFKSFADETTLELLPGLTGIVGPNGCGKSNIVEALRWVMGESSARALRGGESDDLIFAGTQARPARNLMRVSLVLAHTTNLAPPPFEAAPELELQRQVERGAGSTYRINGRVMRARDIQTIFADLASGSRSSSIISQNRVGQLIAARPEERRLLLEEAAGITGLHVRRHDAELKLRQTEANLTRAEERQQQLTERLESLHQQAELARQYRTYSATLRHATEVLLVLRHQQGAEQVRKLTEALYTLQKETQFLQTAQETLQEKLTHGKAELQEQKKTQETLVEHCNKLHLQIEITRNTLLHARKAASERQAELMQLREALTACVSEKSQLLTQHDSETQERQTLETQLNALEKALPSLRQQVEEAETLLEQSSTELAQKTASYQKSSAQRQMLEQQMAHLDAQIQPLEHEKHHLTTQYQALENQHAGLPDLASLEARHNSAQLALKTQQVAWEESQKAHQKAQFTAELAQQALKHGTASLESLKHQQEKLTSRLTDLQQRLQTSTAQEQTTQTELHPKEFFQTLENALQDANTSAKAALTAEQKIRQKRETLEKDWLEFQGKHAQHQQRLQSLEEEKVHLEQQLHQAAQAVRQAQQEHHSAQKKCPSQAALEEAQAAFQHTETKLTRLTSHQNTLSQQQRQAEQEDASAQAALQQLKNTQGRLESESHGLRASLGDVSSQLNNKSGRPSPAPVVLLANTLTCPPDLTHALGNALGEALEGALTPASDTLRFWRTLPPLPLTAPNADSDTLIPFSTLITAPAEARRVLDAIYLAPTPETATRLQPHLQPGQMLVTKDGSLWRWDGYVQRGNIPSPSAQRLELRQKLLRLEEAVALTRQKLIQSQKTRAEKAEHLLHTKENLKTVQATLQQTRQQQAQQHTTLQNLLQQKELAEKELQQLQRHLDQQLTQQHALSGRLQTLQTHLNSLQAAPLQNDTLENDLLQLRQQSQMLTSAREEADKQLRAAHHRLEQEKLQQTQRETRLAELQDTLKQLRTEERQTLSELETIRAESASLDTQALQQKAQTTYATLTQQRQHMERQQQLFLQQREDCAHLQLRIQSLTEQTTRTQQELETLHQNLQQKETQLQQAQQERARLEAALLELPDDQATLTALKTAEHAHQTQKTQATDMRTHAQNALQAQQHLQAQLAQLALRQENNLTQLARLTLTQEQLEKRQTTLSDPQPAEELEKLSQQLGSDEAQFSKLESQRLQATAALTQINLLLTQQTSEKENLQKQLAEKEEKTYRLQERLNITSEQLNRLQQETPLPNPMPTLPADANERDLKRTLSETESARNALGSVNLCAEEEQAQLQEEANQLESEREDLIGAVSRLRTAVQTLNREGRQRLTQVFSDMDTRFQHLFSRMFGGGKAHLGLVGSEDPLEAGLEIFAQPPGKKLSTLSLLSGGEQALTALSLIFAAFQCTPAPLCVLDEVDAPLDDANVERFCTLLRDITQQTGTRFLVVTHHQLTMAHMDRLFGVTMQERGVSRLLSVNLDESAAFLET